ncbi:MAG: hypothetical protein ACI9DM_000257 [Cyclobacteriaceae bacterium]|jgi:hypothetical protein
MSKHIQAPKSIAYIVASTMERTGAEGDKYEERYTIIANEYFSEKLNMFYLPNLQVKYYDANSSDLFELPSDYVDYNKVGIDINGEVWTLGLNEHLAKPRKEACGDRIPVDQTSGGGIPSGGYVFADHYKNGSLRTGLLGLGGGWNFGYFDIDHEERLLSLKGALPKGEVILEYTSSGVKQDGTTMVPLQAVDCVRQELILQHQKRHKKEYSRGDVLDQMQILKDAENLLDRFENTPTASELTDLFYESYGQGAKR